MLCLELCLIMCGHSWTTMHMQAQMHTNMGANGVMFVHNNTPEQTLNWAYVQLCVHAAECTVGPYECEFICACMYTAVLLCTEECSHGSVHMHNNACVHSPVHTCVNAGVCTAQLPMNVHGHAELGPIWVCWAELWNSYTTIQNKKSCNAKKVSTPISHFFLFIIFFTRLLISIHFT